MAAKFTMMIVDDSRLIRGRISRSSSEEYDIVAEAVDGADAIEKFVEKKPNLVTMDLTMPNIDGLQCIEKLVDLDPDVKILVISALSDRATGIAALSKGASGFLMKPFTDEDLVEALEIMVNE